MAENKFRKCDKPIAAADLDALQSKIGFELPEDFRAHYLAFNGGVPERAWWDSLDEHAPCQVTEFKPLRPSAKNGLEHYALSIREKHQLPDTYLPFAVNAAAGCFCFDSKTGGVFHVVFESIDPEKSPEENYRKSCRKLSRSFREFVKGLVSEKELDEDF